MKCPFCKGLESIVIDSRVGRDADSIRRRRECRDCGRRFTSYERVEERVLNVLKRDGRRVPFDRQKLIAGLRRACIKRPVRAEQLEEFVNQLEVRLGERGDSDVPSSDIGAEAMRFLRDVDEVAYVRFASVYRSFASIAEFMDELRKLQAGRPAPSPSEPETSE